MADARAGLEAVKSSLESTEIGGRVYWAPPEASPRVTRGSRATRDVSPPGRRAAPRVHLLPNYDEHVVAYRDHSHSLDPATREALRTRGTAPLAVHLVVRDGLIVGGWRRTFERGTAVLTPQLLTPLKPREMRALEQAAIEFGRFLEMPVKIQGR
jgi:hypothetical protein